MNVARPPLHRVSARASILVMSLVLAATVGWAEPADEKKPETQDKPTATEKAKSDEGKVYTNKDLQRLFAPDPADQAPDGATDAPSAPAAGAPVTPATPTAEQDPLEWLNNRTKAKTDRQSQIDEAQAELFAAEDKLANVRKELLATVNPFSARPELSEEEKAYRRTSGETALERNERTKVMEQEAQAAVDEARTKLERVKRQ